MLRGEGKSALTFLDHDNVDRAREEDGVMLRRMPGWRMRLLAALATIAVLMGPLSVKAAGGTGNEVAAYSGLTAGQRAVL